MKIFVIHSQIKLLDVIHNTQVSSHLSRKCIPKAYWNLESSKNNSSTLLLVNPASEIGKFVYIGELVLPGF